MTNPSEDLDMYTLFSNVGAAVTQARGNEEQLREELKRRAADWAIDYKPWDESLPYRSYAEHGYVQGYVQCLKDIGILV